MDGNHRAARVQPLTQAERQTLMRYLGELEAAGLGDMSMTHIIMPAHIHRLVVRIAMLRGDAEIVQQLLEKEVS